MFVFLKLWLGLQTDRRAVTALEYGLIAALIAGVIITAVTALGGHISDTFSHISDSMSNAKNNMN